MNETVQVKKSKEADHGALPSLWIVFCIGIALFYTAITRIESVRNDFFIAICFILSIVLVACLLFINEWARGSRFAKPRFVLPPVSNPFWLVFAIGAYACIAIAIMNWQTIFRSSNSLFFAGMAGALACLGQMMALTYKKP